eukprot:3859697-Pyramimonas_sp.AAC.3
MVRIRDYDSDEEPTESNSSENDENEDEEQIEEEILREKQQKEERQQWLDAARVSDHPSNHNAIISLTTQTIPSLSPLRRI